MLTLKISYMHTLENTHNIRYTPSYICTHKTREQTNIHSYEHIDACVHMLHVCENKLYACMHVYKRIHLYIYICVCVCVCVCMHTHVLICIYAYVCNHCFMHAIDTRCHTALRARVRQPAALLLSPSLCVCVYV